MSDNIAIKVEGVNKSFKLPHEKVSSIKSAVVYFYKRKRTFEKQEVLNNISFEIKKGEFFGIVGRNGSGKSTLLKLLAGIYEPDSGQIRINGKLTPFIELGVGFSPELTGRENVFLNGALLGFSRREMDAKYEDIVKFAELERFMDQKLKNYSSGMQVRLAFSIAIRAKSDILLIDEVLAVGDAAFQTKCFDYFYALKKTSTTVIFVSHDRTSLERFCERGVLINDGEMLEYGDISRVLKSYSSIVLNELDKADTNSNKDQSLTKATPVHAEIRNTMVIDSSSKQKRIFSFGEDIIVSFDIRALTNLSNPVIGVTIWQKNVNKAIYATNTLIEGINKTGIFKKGETIKFSSKLPKSLNDGEYFVEPAIANEAATVQYDQVDKASTFFVNGSNNPHSIIANFGSINIEKEIKNV